MNIDKGKRKPAKLKNLTVNEISFVDRGANPGANILLYKRKDVTMNSSDPKSSLDKRGNLQGDPRMDIQELAKMLGDVGKAVTTLTDTVTKGQSDLAAVTAKLEALEKAGKKPKGECDGDPEMDDAAAAKKKAEQDALEKAKNEIPEPLRKQMESMEKALEETKKGLADAKKGQEEALSIAKAEREARELMALEKRAETEFPNVPGDATTKAQLLKQIEAMPDEVKKFALETLKSTNDSVGQSFEEKGSSYSPTVAIGKKAALDALDTMAKALFEKRKGEEGFTYEKAYAEAIQSPDGQKHYAQIG